MEQGMGQSSSNLRECNGTNKPTINGKTGLRQLPRAIHSAAEETEETNRNGDSEGASSAGVSEGASSGIISRVLAGSSLVGELPVVSTPGVFEDANTIHKSEISCASTFVTTHCNAAAPFLQVPNIPPWPLTPLLVEAGVANMNGGLTSSPKAIEAEFKKLCGGSCHYFSAVREGQHYWSWDRYPNAHRRATIDVSHLVRLVPNLHTFSQQAKQRLVTLLEEERKVVRNLAGSYLRDKIWKKGRALGMMKPEGGLVQMATDVIRSMVGLRTKDNWARGAIALHYQFIGKEWVRDLEQHILATAFSVPILYLEEYDLETAQKLPRAAISSGNSQRRSIAGTIVKKRDTCHQNS
jgi:hypothetical protein